MNTGRPDQPNQKKTVQTLKKRTDFIVMNRKARKWVAHGVVVQALANDSGDIRVGFTVTKKTEKSAVRRNRIKRRLRAAAFEILPLYAKTSHDYVLIGKSMSATRPFASLCNDLKWCLDKLGCANHIEQDHAKLS